MAKKKIIPFIILAIIALSAIFLPGYAKLQDLITENKRLEERITKLQKSVTDLAAEKEKLENDINYIEKVAREKMGLVKEGEKKIEREE